LAIIYETKQGGFVGNNRPNQIIDTKQGSDRGICPVFRFLAFDVRCLVSPATPLGLDKIMGEVTQGSPADGTTLGWMMQSRWDKQMSRRRWIRGQTIL
jgi:hypothetical protein